MCNMIFNMLKIHSTEMPKLNENIFTILLLTAVYISHLLTQKRPDQTNDDYLNEKLKYIFEFLVLSPSKFTGKRPTTP